MTAMLVMARVFAAPADDKDAKAEVRQVPGCGR